MYYICYISCLLLFNRSLNRTPGPRRRAPLAPLRSPPPTSLQVCLTSDSTNANVCPETRHVPISTNWRRRSIAHQVVRLERRSMQRHRRCARAARTRPPGEGLERCMRMQPPAPRQYGGKKKGGGGARRGGGERHRGLPEVLFCHCLCLRLRLRLCLCLFACSLARSLARLHLRVLLCTSQQYRLHTCR